MRYPNLRSLKAGDHIRPRRRPHSVKRMSRYGKLRGDARRRGPANVNPDSPCEQQLANIRRIYGPEKEALGVLALEIELLQPATA